MKTMTRSLTLLLALGAAAGCAADPTTGDDVVTPDDGARLTIVGESSILLENGWTSEITVRYTDLDDAPLAGGEIDFTLTGTVGGAWLDELGAVADADGEATLTLTAGELGDSTFAIEASAADADPAVWNVQVLERALEVTGDYRLSSDFDLATGLPGTAGTVINTFIDMTDDPNDPATWVLDQVVASISNSTVRDFINSARPTLDLILNELLIELSPDIVGQLVDVGDAFGQIARKFGTISTLRVSESNDADGALAALHLLTELVFTIDGDHFPYPLADMGVPAPSAEVPFSYNATRFTVGAHAFPMSYGTILMVALEQIIIPLVDPSANSLDALLVNLVDCEAVGAAVADYIGFGTAGLYEGACALGISGAATAIEEQIRSLDDAAMILGISGDARWIDSNMDREIDVLQGGTWTGNMSYAGTPAPLGPSTFRGERLAGPN